MRDRVMVKTLTSKAVDYLHEFCQIVSCFLGGVRKLFWAFSGHFYCVHGLSRITLTGNDNSSAAYMAVLSLHTYVCMLCSDDMATTVTTK